MVRKNVTVFWIRTYGDVHLLRLALINPIPGPGNSLADSGVFILRIDVDHARKSANLYELTVATRNSF